VSGDFDMGNLASEPNVLLAANMVGRRDFLKRTLFAATTVASVAVLPVGCGNYPDSGAVLRVLSDKEFTVLQAAAELIIGSSGPDEPTVAQVKAIEHLDQNVLVKMAPNVLADFKSLLFVVEHGPLVFEAALSPFTELSDVDKTSYIDGFMRSDIDLRKALFMGLKVVSVTAYFAMTESWTSVGYNGPFKWQLGDAAPRALGISTLNGGSPDSARPGALRISSGTELGSRAENRS